MGDFTPDSLLQFNRFSMPDQDQRQHGFAVVGSYDSANNIVVYTRPGRDSNNTTAHGVKNIVLKVPCDLTKEGLYKIFYANAPSRCGNVNFKPYEGGIEMRPQMAAHVQRWFLSQS